MLIDFFSGKSTTTTVSSEKPEAGYTKPAQENRQVEATPDNLAIVTHKKKGEEEESYFVSGKCKNKGKKGPKAIGAAAATEVPSFFKRQSPFCSTPHPPSAVVSG